QTKTAGEYIVTVTDVNGCTQKDTVNLIVNLLPTPNLGTDVIICEDANEVTFDAGTFNSYAWNTGATSQTIQTKTADEYIVTVKDNNGCSKNDTVNLIVNPIPTPNLGADVTICTDANEVTFDAGTFNSYAWNTGTTNQTIQTKTAGEYIVTVTDVNGCTKKDTVNLIVNQLPTPNLGPDVTICEDANEVTFDAGTFNSYAWNTGTTTQTIQTKTAGEYIVTVTDVNGCTKKDTVNLIVNPIPTPNLGADVTICADANEVTFDAGTFAFYAWNTGTTTQTIQTKTAGEYIVTVTDVNGCTKNDTVNLIVNPIPTPNLGNDTAICIGSNPITFTPGNFATYLWNNSETNFSIQTNTAGIYNVTVTDNNGCIASDTIELFVNPLPSPNLGADVNICADANEVTFDAGTFTSYAWSNGATTQTIQTKTAGEYIVAVTDNNGCSKNDTVNLIVNPIPTPNLGADVTICSDANEVTFDAGTFASYSWNTGATTQTIQTKNAGDYIVTVLDANGCTKNDTVNLIVNQLPTPKLQKDTAICIDAPAITLNPGNYAEYLWSTAATSPTIDVNTAGQYIVGVKDINGCVASDTFNLSIKTLPIVDINDITVCPNINANFDAGTFTAYLWHDGSSNASFSTTDSMKVWVTVTDNNGCKNSDTARVFIKNQLDVNLGADIEICLGESAILDAGNLYNNPTYVWSTSETTQTISVNTFGEYFVEVTDQDGCKGYDTLNVIVHNLPTPKLQNDTAICIDAPAITLNPGNYVEYLWSTAATSPTINVNTAGQYIVGVKDINGCVASDTFNLSIKTLPIVDINDITVCPNITANFNAGNFAVYEWHDGSSNATFNTTDSIKVWVVVTDNNGCKNSDTARVFIKNQLDVNLGADIEICLGESAILDAGNLYHNPTYVWNTSAHTQTISVNTSGEYFVEVTDQDGCKGSDTINVLVHPNPTIDIGNDAEICSNATHEFAVTGTWNQIKWSTGANTPSIEVTNQNQYWVEVMDNNNCLGRDTVQLVVHSNPQPSIGVDQWICPDEIATFNAGNFSSYLWHDGSTTSSYTSGDSSLVWVEVRNQFNCVGRDTAYLRIHPRLTVDLGPDQEICSGESYTIQTGLNAQNHTFTWSNNSTTANINVNKAGSYTVNVTNTNGCKANDEILITVNANPTPTVADATVCEGTTAVLNGGTYHAYEWRLNGQSNVLGTNQTFNPITEGVYSLTVTDDKGCKGTTQATVNVILKPVIPSIPDLFACEGENVLAQPNLPNGSVLWSNGSTSRSQFLNTPGKYWITVSSAPNCNATDTFDFIWRTLPEVDLGDDFGFCIGESANISVPNGFSNVLWNTGAKTNTITVNTTGTYIVTVTDNFGCKGTSAINVNVSNLPNFTRTPNQVVCFEEIGSLDLEVNSSLRNNIVWINDFSTINKLTVANAGSYIFTVTNFDGCSKSDTILITERCTPRIFVPNAITPNGDGINDYFTAKGIAISNFEMYIFSRWGEEIYYTNEIEKGWDGTYMGNVVHVDVYVYKIYYTLDDKAGEYKREQMVGTVTVLR
ncbi:MAG: hypothetical protein RLZZ414_1528, partial [Bacteroidota bacterium]